MKRLLLFALVACHKTSLPKADADAAPEPIDAAPYAAPEAAAPSKHLSLITKPGKGIDSVCLVVDDTGYTVGHATTKQTAAGGSTVECDHFVADGKVIVFKNSRGTYAKDGRPGPTNDTLLPCGEGVFADDVSSCIRLDESSFSFTPDDPKAEDFVIAMVDIARSNPVSLITIPQGLGRRSDAPRPWDAAYCTNTRAVVVAKGGLDLIAAPAGKALAWIPAKGATRVECRDGIVTINKPTRRFRLDADALTSLED